jgi:molybdate/tungstate transport system ATP-binding protein
VILVQHLTIRAGSFTISDVTFEVPTGGYAALMGKTGSGKTTLLEAIAGLKPVVSGKIVLDNTDVTRLRPAQRNLGYVPQDGALFTTMTVREQLAFALTIRRRPSGEVQDRVDALAKMLGITSLLDRSIHGLSGGERQRIALGRALSFQPGILCLDEPLSALDDGTRQQMYDLLGDIRRQTGVTTLHVTHSLDEARHLADQILMVEHGRVRPWDPDSSRAERDLPRRPESEAAGGNR